MKVTGFSFIKNALQFDFPIKEAILSILPLCDQIIVAVGVSDDETLQLIKNIHSEKIIIIETFWDETQREGGKVLALETDKAYHESFGVKPIPVRSGGSIPIVALFEKELKSKTILMGFGLDSDAIHSPNEHFGIFNYLKGIETIPLFYKYFVEMSR